MFHWGLAVAVMIVLIVALFCYIYFAPRKSGAPPKIDRKAGDEGEEP